jgi:hypothetical protein
LEVQRVTSRALKANLVEREFAVNAQHQAAEGQGDECRRRRNPDDPLGRLDGLGSYFVSLCGDFSARLRSLSKVLRFGTGISTGGYGLPVVGSMPFG